MTVRKAPEQKGAVYHIDERVAPGDAVQQAKSAFLDKRRGYSWSDIKARHYGEGADGHVVVVLYDMVNDD